MFSFGIKAIQTLIILILLILHSYQECTCEHQSVWFFFSIFWYWKFGVSFQKKIAKWVEFTLQNNSQNSPISCCQRNNKFCWIKTIVYTTQSWQLHRQKACFLHGQNFLWSINTPAGCTSKAGVHRNTPLLRVFQCLLFFFSSFWKRERYLLVSKRATCRVQCKPHHYLPHITGSLPSTPVLGGSLILDQTPTGGWDMVYRHI